MKIVSLSDFIKLPAGTVYSHYEPYVFNGLMIKGESVGDIDFFYKDLVGSLECKGSYDIQCEKAEQGQSVSLDFKTEGRDGTYELDRLFAVYDGQDIQGFTAVLNGWNVIIPIPR